MQQGAVGVPATNRAANLKARINVDNIFDEDTLAFISPSVSGLASFRPQSPRTVSFSLTAEF